MPRCALLATLAVASLLGRSPAAEPAPHLAFVPPGGAIFVQANVAKIWQSPLGDSLRQSKIPDFDRVLAEAEALTGLTPADVTSVAFYLPAIKSDADIQSFGVSVLLAKPLDQGRLLSALTVIRRVAEDKFNYKFEKNVLSVNIDMLRRPGAKQNLNQLVVDMGDPRCVHVFFQLPESARQKVAAAVTGPLSPALLAAATSDLAVGVNWAALPDEIRDEQRLPPEVRPFAPLLKSDSLTAAGRLKPEAITLDFRFRSGDALVVRDCEKSLAAMQTLLTAGLAAGQKQLAKSKLDSEKLTVPLLKTFAEAVDGAAIRVEDKSAVATLTLKPDLQFAAALGAQFGARVERAGNRAMGQNNLKQLGLAMHNYHDANNGFPPAAIVGKKGKPLLSWRVMVLPYIEQDNLYRQFKLDEPWDSTHNLKVFNDNPMPKTFMLPGVSKETDKETYYRVFVGKGAGFDALQPTPISSYTDGTSNTIMIATAGASVPWSKPDELAFDPKGEMKKLLMLDKDGCSVVLADGSVRYIRGTTPEETLKALITRSGGEVIGLDD